MEVEDVLESNDSSQDSRLKSVSVEINSFKRHFPVKPLNGESSNKDFADIMSVVNTIKAVSSAYQGTDKGDHQILNTDTTNKHQRDSICKKLNGSDQNYTAVGEPESKRVKLRCDRTYRDNDFQTVDKESDKTPDEGGSSEPNGTSSEEALGIHTERMPDNGNTLETSCSEEGELELRLEIEATPEKSDTDEQDDLNYKVKKTVEDYSTPIKNDLCSEEARRSPFLIGDKIRKSLKGIVEKVKSSPDHKRNLGSCLDDKEDRVLEDVLVDDKLSKQDPLSPIPDRKIEESAVETCDKDNEKTSSKLEVATVQSDSIDKDNVKDQNKHIPADSVRLKENDTLNKNLDDQDLLLGIEDDTQIDISSDKEDELLQDNSSGADINYESVVFLRTEVNNLDKNTDLTSKFDDSDISGSLETNVSNEDRSVGIKSSLSSLKGGNDSDKNLEIDTQETLPKEDNAKEVILEKESSDTNESINIPNQSCNNSETNLGSNENKVDKENIGVKNSFSVHSQCSETSSASPTEKLEVCDKDAKVKIDDEDDVIFEGFDEPKVTNEESTKSDQLDTYNSCKDKVSKINFLDAAKDANTVCEKMHCDSEMKSESENRTAKDDVKCKPISNTDSDINLIEEDEVVCKDKRQSNSTDSESTDSFTSKSDSKILYQKAETEDVRSCERKAESKKSHLNELEQKLDEKDNASDDDDDDDVIFEGVVKPTDSKIDESSNDMQDNTGLCNETKVDTTKADKESKTISKTDDEDCKFKEDRSSIESSNSASDKTESLSDTKMSVEEEDDDDVIFEGVDKPDNTKTEKERTESTDSVTSNSQPVTKAGDKNSKTTTSESDKIETKAANDLGEEADKEIIYDRMETQASANMNSESEVKSSVKRRAEESSEHDSNPKRTRLDEVIGKLGSQIGVEPESIEVSESDDDEEESATDTAVEEKSEDTSDNDNEDDESNSECEKVKYVKITEKELEELVRERVAAYLASQRETIIAQLTQKVKDLQVSNDQWKSQVKELQVKVTDVTVLNLKHEKRKAATAALRQITTRSVSVQVDEGKTAVSQRGTPKTPEHSVNMVKSPLQKPVQQNPVPLVTAPPGSNGTIRLPIPQSAIAPPVLAAQMPQLPHPPATISTTHYQTPTVKALLDTTRQQITSGSLTKTSPATSVVSNTPQVVHYPQRVAAQSKTGFVTAAPQIPSSQVVGSPTVPMASKNIGPTTQMTSATGTTTLKVIDLTADEGDNRQPKVLTLPAAQMHTLNQLRSVVPNQQPQQFVLNQNGQLIQTSPSGSQGQAFHLVFNTSTPALRTGNVPQTGTVIQTVAQPNVTTQGTMGTQQMVTQVPGQAMLRPPTSSSQITSLLSQTKLKETANTIKAPTTVFEEQIKPALRKKLETNSPASTVVVPVHPAPLPLMPVNQPHMGLKLLPPKPSLKISRVSQGIVLSWNMTINDTHEEIASYQLYAYQEGATPPTTALWKKVGDVKALPLPMACTLTQFQVGNKYHFAVRAVDVNTRVGHFSDYSSIHLTPLPTPPGGKS